MIIEIPKQQSKPSVIMGLLLPPWIWVVGLWFSLTGFIFTFNAINKDFDIFDKSLVDNQAASPFFIWASLTIILIINYSIYRNYYSKINKLSILTFISSLFITILTISFFINIVNNFLSIA